MKKRTFKCKCKECGNIFESNSNRTLYCDNCLERKICHECGSLTEKKYLKTDKHIHICEKCASKYKRVSRNVCHICGKEFFSESNRALYCNECLTHPKCNECGKIINKFITIMDHNVYYCNKKCANIHKAKENIKPGNCVICGKFNEHRDALGQGIDCGCLTKHLDQKRQEAIKPGNCVICGKFSEIRDHLGRCKKCHDDWYNYNNQLPSVRAAGDKNLIDFHYDGEPNFITKNNVRYYKNKELIQLCDSLLFGKEDINDYPGFEIRLGRITYNRKDVLTDESILLNQNFIARDDVKFYKNELVTNVIDKLNSGEYDVKNFPGWNKRFGTWHYNTEDVLTGDVNLLKGSNFYEKNKELWYLDRSIRQYVPWEEFKSRFVTTNIDFLNQIQIDYPSAKIIPTFREQNSDTWKGAKEAFEQSLVEQGISWMTYIKFYIDENNITKPLVTGKTGSKLVNSDGTDVRFSEWNPDDPNCKEGPARKFLYQNVLNWDKTQILIIPYEIEEEAYNVEKEIIKNFNLFKS